MWTRKVVSSLGRNGRAKLDLSFLAAAAVLVSQNQTIEDSKEDYKHDCTADPNISSFLQKTTQDHSAGLPFLTNHHVQCEPRPRGSSLRRHRTLQLMENRATKSLLKSKYNVQWKIPLGIGSFGSVFLATDVKTGQKVAVKKISKRFTNDASFQREMDALLGIRDAGGHPNICGVREHFDEGSYFYLVLDLVTGGELFDMLCSHGPYSEADAARLVREVTSALAFLHGIGIIHGDMKPENVMLSSESAADQVVKVVDFGCAQVNAQKKIGQSSRGPSRAGNTPAYSPPEVFLDKKRPLDKAYDMWALGVIVYVMLTGVHPFDLYGDSTDEEIKNAIVSGKGPPLRKSPLTAHLSKDAIEVIEKLLTWNPRRRLTANQLLDNPWVRGETARQSKIADSDKRLSAFRAFKTKIGEKVFKDIVSMTTQPKTGGVAKRTSLIEQAFQNFDPNNDGYVSIQQLKLSADGSGDISGGSAEQLSLSDFSSLLSDNMRNRYYPKGHVVYREGDRGDHMYFLNSGVVEVYTKAGFSKTLRNPGDFFGEGALLHAERTRSASIKCITPVHAMEVPREYFEKYLASDMGVNLDLRAKDKTRQRQIVHTILQLQKNLTSKEFTRNQTIFDVGEDAKELYILEDGKVEISVDGGIKVFEVKSGAMLGEFSLIFGRPRNVTATCITDTCKVRILGARDFHRLLRRQPALQRNLRDICYVRQFQKAICVSTGKPFPRTEKELRATFEKFSSQDKDSIELATISEIIHALDPSYSEKDVRDILRALDLSASGSLEWEEFKRIFDMPTGES